MTRIVFDGLPENQARNARRSTPQPESAEDQQSQASDGWHSDIRRERQRNNTRPNFLCIGLPHAGTTWLHGVLSTHPDVALPRGKKELRFFDCNYHRGEQWYLNHFRHAEQNALIRCVGEIGPAYIYGDVAPARIAAFGSVRKLIVMLRDPLSSMISRYHSVEKVSKFSADHTYYLKHHGHEFELLRTFSYMQNFLEHFRLEEFSFILMDDLRHNEAAIKARLADFLEIRRDGFDQALPAPFYNQARSPRFRSIYSTARRVRDRYFPEFEWISTVESRIPLLRPLLFQRPDPAPEWLLDELRSRRRIINEQTSRLGDLIGRDLSGWLIE